jgi:hypothetical protein
MEEQRSHCAAKCDSTGCALIAAAAQTRLAARACLEWEQGGEAQAVSETAALARHFGSIAIEAVVSDEPWGDPLDEPQTRRARLAYGAWLLVLAGTDECGESRDLVVAGELFERAARA